MIHVVQSHHLVVLFVVPSSYVMRRRPDGIDVVEVGMREEREEEGDEERDEDATRRK